MAEIDTVAMDMLVGIASSAVTEAGKAVAERLFDRQDPFAALWTEAVDCLDAEEHELRQLHAADVRRAFAAGMIRNTDALSLLIQDKIGIIADRADELAPYLANTLTNACRDLAVQAAKGSEQAHRVIDQIDHAETKNLLQRLLGLVLDLAERSQLSPPPVEHVIPHMAPPPPANYVGRPAETNALLAALLADSEGRAVGITTALRGAGGFGKTTLAQQICSLDEVKAHLPDGILWVTLGENPGDLTGRINGLLRNLGYTGPDFTDVDQASGHLATLIGERRMLMVIDDAWSSAHVASFMRGGKRCVRLITTRQGAVLPPGTVDVFADAMQPSEAIHLLGFGLSVPGSCDLRPLATRLGEWPLLLNIVNGILRKRLGLGDDLPDALLCVDLALDVQGLTAFDPDDPAARNEAVAATVRVSLQMLRKQQRERYLELAIFPEDVDVPLAVVARLWGATSGMDEGAVEDLCILLKDASLLLDLNLGQRTLRLHDVMRDLVMREVAAARRADLHLAFLGAYGVEHWADLPTDEQYLWRHAVYHLAAADRADELRDLLFDYRWMAAKLQATDLVALMADYDHFPEDGQLRLVQGALRLSGQFIGDDPHQLPSQLWGRLTPDDGPAIADLLVQAWDIPGYPWLRPLSPTLERPGGHLERILRGHTSWVFALSMTDDGLRAISGGQDGTVRVWDLESGAETHCFKPDSGSIWAVGLDEDGQRAIFGGWDGVVHLRDLGAETEHRRLHGHYRAVWAIGLSADGRCGISGGEDGAIRVWDPVDGAEQHCLAAHPGGVHAASVTADGLRAVSGGENGEICVWDLSDGTERARIAVEGGRVRAIDMSADGSRAVFCGDDSGVFLCDLANGECQELGRHSGTVWAVSLSADGCHAASGGSDGTVRIWSVENRGERLLLEGHTGAVRAVSMNADGSRVVSAGDDQTVRVWACYGGPEPRPAARHLGAARTASVTSDGRRAVSGGDDGTLRVWDTESGSEVLWLDAAAEGRVWCVDMTPNGGRAVSAGEDGVLHVWDLSRGQETERLEGPAGAIWGVSLSANGERAVSGGDDGAVWVWDLVKGAVVHRLVGHGWYLLGRPGTAGADEAQRDPRDHVEWIRDVASSPEYDRLDVHCGAVCSVSLSADGRRAVSGGMDGTVRAWDIDARRECCRLDGHGFWVRAVDISADASVAVGCGRGGGLSAWDLDSGAERRLVGNTGPVWAVAVDACGRTAASTCRGRLAVCDLASGEQSACFRGDAWFLGCAITPDGRTVVAGDHAGRVHFLRLENADASPE